MQPAVANSLIALGITAFLAFIVWIIRRELALQAETERTWRAYAARRHLQWTEASGPWIRRMGYSMAGDIDGVRMTIDQCVVRRGKSSVRYTRVSAAVERAAPERLIVARKTFSNRMQFAWQGPLVELDDAVGSQPLLVRCRSPRFASSMVDQRMRTSLYAMPTRTYVECTGREAKVWWLGAERDTAVLDRAAELLASVVRAAGKA